MSNGNCDSDDIVTLVLRESRIEASRHKLAGNSLYFASLFSKNFKDHRQKDFAINYEITLNTLQAFVDWTSNEGEPCNSIDSVRYNFIVKKPLLNLLTGSRLELMELLELSVVFFADKLTEDVMEIIACRRLSPDDMLEIWQLAEDLYLRSHADAALAICLDRFDELTVAHLMDLSPDHFTKLLCNHSIRSSPDRLMNIRTAWIECNGIAADMTDLTEEFLKCTPEEVIIGLKEAEPHYLQCLVGHKLDKTQVVYAWTGNFVYELAHINREIIARQVVARGFNIYVVGRKRDVNYGQFNTTIWRYCPFTRKWYVETILPRRRQNMAVIILDKKMYLFGGTEYTGKTTYTLDVYDLYTGVWSKASNIPSARRLTEVRSSCVADGKIVYRRCQTHVYDPLVDTWKTYNVTTMPIPCWVEVDWAHINILIGAYKKSNIDIPIVYVRNWQPVVRHSVLKMFILTSEYKYPDLKMIHNWGRSTIDDQLMIGCVIVSFGYKKGCVIIEEGQMVQSNEEGRITSTYKHLLGYRQRLRDVPTNVFKLHMGCFNMYNPRMLHDLVHILV